MRLLITRVLGCWFVHERLKPVHELICYWFSSHLHGYYRPVIELDEVEWCSRPVHKCFKPAHKCLKPRVVQAFLWLGEIVKYSFMLLYIMIIMNGCIISLFFNKMLCYVNHQSKFFIYDWIYYILLMWIIF